MEMVPDTNLSVSLLFEYLSENRDIAAITLTNEEKIRKYLVKLSQQYEKI